MYCGYVLWLCIVFVVFVVFICLVFGCYLLLVVCLLFVFCSCLLIGSGFVIFHFACFPNNVLLSLSRNPTQLGVCMAAPRLRGEFSLLAHCGANSNSFECYPQPQCTWFVPPAGDLKTKLNARPVCLPLTVIDMFSKFTQFASIIDNNLPFYLVMITCLAKPSDQCDMGCTWCGPVDTTNAYGSDNPVTGLCFPNSLPTAYCNDFKATSALTRCPPVQGN